MAKILGNLQKLCLNHVNPPEFVDVFCRTSMVKKGPPRPDHPTEKGRIEAAGGSVSFEEMAGDGAEDGAERPEFSRKMLEK